MNALCKISVDSFTFVEEKSCRSAERATQGKGRTHTVFKHHVNWCFLKTTWDRLQLAMRLHREQEKPSRSSGDVAAHLVPGTEGRFL